MTIYGFGTEEALRDTIRARDIVLGRRNEVAKPRGPRDPGGGCDSQNTIWDITVFGSPTSGTFSMPIVVNNVTETKTFAYNDSAATVKTTLATHAEIASTDLDVTGGPFPNATMRIEFIDTLAGKLILQPIAAWGSLSGGTGRGVIIALAQRGN